MGSLRQKLDWLINLKLLFVNAINNKYNQYPSGKLTGNLGNISWSTIDTRIKAMYPKNYCEVLVHRRIDENGGTSLLSSPDYGYSKPGVTYSITKLSTGIFTINVYRPQVLGTTLVAWTVGGRRSSINDRSTYATISPTYISPTQTTYRVITGDDNKVYQGEFVLIVMSVFSIP